MERTIQSRPIFFWSLSFYFFLFFFFFSNRGRLLRVVSMTGFVGCREHKFHAEHLCRTGQPLLEVNRCKRDKSLTQLDGDEGKV